jgi:hypothetical protein
MEKRYSAKLDAGVLQQSCGASPSKKTNHGLPLRKGGSKQGTQRGFASILVATRVAPSEFDRDVYVVIDP